MGILVIVNDEMNEQGVWEILPIAPPYMNSNVEWVDGNARFFPGFPALSGIQYWDNPPPFPFPFPSKCVITFRLKFLTSIGLFMFKGDTEDAYTGLVIGSTSVSMSNINKSISSVLNVWYDYELRFDGRSCEVWRTAEPNPPQYIRTYSPLIEAGGNHVQFALFNAFGNGVALLDYFRVTTEVPDLPLFASVEIPAKVKIRQGNFGVLPSGFAIRRQGLKMLKSTFTIAIRSVNQGLSFEAFCLKRKLNGRPC